MKPIGKTPYEIRLEILQLAQLILENQHTAKNALSSSKTSPTTEEIMSEAEKLNGFVSKANQPH